MRTRIIAAAALALASTTASAAVVQFPAPFPSTGWTDGTFTHDISGPFPDGFYQFSGATDAYNAFGQYGLQIIFDSPVTLNSLMLGRCSTCFDSNPTAFTVTLTDSATIVIGNGSVGNGPLSLLTFNTPGVKAITFGFYGNSGNPYAGDSRSVAWYVVKDVTYNATVPEPASWAMLVAGFGLVGAAARLRKQASARA